VCFPDDPLRYLEDTLSWIPTVIPSLPGNPAGQGLNWYGPTVINRTGGVLFRDACALWAQLFSQGPEQLTLRGPFSYRWPSEAEETTVTWDQLADLGEYDRIKVDREWLVQALTTLSGFGQQAAMGSHFILHVDI